MTEINIAVFCLAYLLGLLLSAIPGQWGLISGGAIALCLSSCVLAFIVPRWWRGGPRPKIWLLAGIVGVAATLYFDLRIPHPAATDISTQVEEIQPSVSGSPKAMSAKSLPVEVGGQIVTSPRLTRSQRIQFELAATHITRIHAETHKVSADSVTGKLYVTVPLLQGTGLYPGQTVAVNGSLYRPKPATNPGGFDFEDYLTQAGIFAGLSGTQVSPSIVESDNLFSIAQKCLWQIRQRIVRIQTQVLGVPEGPLISAMLLGRNGVDLSYDVQDIFAQVGLAHALAASGFQVSLLLQVVMSLTKNLPVGLRFALGLGSLSTYIGLTGLEASVFRAGVMGFAVLLGLTLERKVKPMGAILAAATLMLLIKPLWIWDLGFQLSFLATLGLLVTVPVLMKWLDNLPPAIASLMAVPLAAYVWTLPLQLFTFGNVSPYSIAINILTAPLITVISMGSAISALFALLPIPIGHQLTNVLYYPTRALIGLATWGSHLPGSSIAVGSISVSQLVVLYGLYGLIWWQWQSQWRKQWWIVGITCTGLVVAPAYHRQMALSQITILAASDRPIAVIQHRGKTAILGEPSEQDARYTILPFLTKQGINRIDWAIALNRSLFSLPGWIPISEKVPIQRFYTRFDLQAIAQKSNSLSATTQASTPPNSLQIALAQYLLNQLQTHGIHYEPVTAQSTLPIEPIYPSQILDVGIPGITFTFANQTWLLLQPPTPDPQSQSQLSVALKRLPLTQVLWWSGAAIHRQIVQQTKPQVAIASLNSISDERITSLNPGSITVYVTGRDGAIQWTPQRAFVTLGRQDL
jgi:competence protein ComEC